MKQQRCVSNIKELMSNFCIERGGGDVHEAVVAVLSAPPEFEDNINSVIESYIIEKYTSNVLVEMYSDNRCEFGGDYGNSDVKLMTSTDCASFVSGRCTLQCLSHA
jgi:hypothetical protein